MKDISMELNVKGKIYFINTVSASRLQPTFKKLPLSSFGVVLKKNTPSLEKKLLNIPPFPNYPYLWSWIFFIDSNHNGIQQQNVEANMRIPLDIKRIYKNVKWRHSFH